MSPVRNGNVTAAGESASPIFALEHEAIEQRLPGIGGELDHDDKDSWGNPWIAKERKAQVCVVPAGVTLILTYTYT